MPIARVALPIAAPTTFDYWVPDGLSVARGSTVTVRLGPRTMAGVVVDIAADSPVDREKLQTISSIAQVPPVPPDVLDLAAFVSTYYHEPIGLAFALAVPPLRGAAAVPRAEMSGLRLTAEGRHSLSAMLGRAPAARRIFDAFEGDEGVLPVEAFAALAAHQKRTLRLWRQRGWVENATTNHRHATASAHVLNAEQQDAVDAVLAASGTFAPFLLHGVTGSGKTDVYLSVAERVIATGGQVLFLVPEINLTPQFTQRIATALPSVRIATLHSGLSEGERRAHWLAAATGQARLVLGTRLAVFAPLPDLGLVVIDEEHDGSYKQQDNVRYHARDAAVWRAQRRSVPVVLGSATPSLESWLHAREGRYRRLDLRRRADPRATLPRVAFTGNRPARPLEGVGEMLRAAIADRLARGEQSLVFVNRRGFSPSIICSSCQWEAQCKRCNARLTTHRDPPSLQCHHCGHLARLPQACPSCGNVDLLPMGYGTQRLERILRDAFPDARIARVDRDSTRAKGAFAAVRDQVAANTLDILVGTQMLAKGHDFPRLTLVGILGADNALYSADFRATERLASLLMQVAGRAGRAGLPGEIIVQTDFPTHPVFAALAAHDHDAFAATLLQEREDAQLPPVTHAALLGAEAHARADVTEFLSAVHALGTRLVERDHGGVVVFEPVPALLSRRAGFERGQIVVQSVRRQALQRFLTIWHAEIEALPGRRVRWALDVDPAGFG